ncbi:MAG: ArsR family transcriptional regulator [Frankiales bacterium]|nr:ArsR family transcriptional regulator [Frankiales bacterium]
MAMNQATLGPAVALFRSLGDPTRLAIVAQLAGQEQRVVDLTRTLGLAQSTVSAHLSCLADCGLVAARPVGRSSLYRLIQPALLDLLSEAEQLLEATGYAVDLCPNYGGSSNQDERPEDQPIIRPEPDRRGEDDRRASRLRPPVTA